MLDKHFVLMCPSLLNESKVVKVTSCGRVERKGQLSMRIPLQCSQILLGMLGGEHAKVFQENRPICIKVGRCD